MENLKELLYRSFDEELSGEEQKLLEEGLRKYPELQEEKEELESLRQGLHELDLSFEQGFADRVMANPQINPSPKTVELHSAFFTAFKRVAWVGAAAIIALLFTIYFTEGALDMDAIYGLSSYDAYEAEVSYFDYQEN